MVVMLVLLVFTLLFAVWVLDIFDMDYSKGNQFIIALFIGGILVYWRLGRFVVTDDSHFIGFGVLILVLASMYKSSIEKN